MYRGLIWWFDAFSFKMGPQTPQDAKPDSFPILCKSLSQYLWGCGVCLSWFLGLQGLPGVTHPTPPRLLQTANVMLSPEHGLVLIDRRLLVECNREIVSCRAVRACVRKRGLVAYWTWIAKVVAYIFSFLLLGRRAFPFPFWARRGFPFPFPPKPPIQL